MVRHFMVVLGTLHQTHLNPPGMGVPDAPRDSFYRPLLEFLITSEGADFVFEEAAGKGPTTARLLAEECLGKDRYADVDPPRNHRERASTPQNSNQPYMIGSPPEAAFADWQYLDVHERRENLWLAAITKQRFGSGLMICGIAHMLSFSFRLQAAGFTVKGTSYLPPSWS